ncbi:hypothetical protein LTR27_010395 [Elasticomyces elasticus]|nr:hypothetical protein LTR27_010395 [Elasticomyces elasticus]
MAQKSQHKPSEAKIRHALRQAYPVTDVHKYIEMLRLYGKEFRYHKNFQKGEIKDPQSEKELVAARAKLFGVLYTREEKAALAATYPDSYPLRSPDWAAKQWEQKAGDVALRTVKGGDTDMAQVFEGLGLARDKQEAQLQATARAILDYMIDNGMS